MRVKVDKLRLRIPKPIDVDRPQNFKNMMYL